MLGPIAEKLLLDVQTPINHNPKVTYAVCPLVKSTGLRVLDLPSSQQAADVVGVTHKDPATSLEVSFQEGCRGRIARKPISRSVAFDSQ